MTDAAFLAWLLSPDAITVTLVEAVASVAGTETTRYLSTGTYVTGASDTPANTAYLAVVDGSVQITESLAVGAGEGMAASMNTAAISILNPNGERDSWLNDVWVNRTVKAYIGDVRWPRSDFRIIFSGVTADLSSSSRDTLDIVLTDKLQRLNAAVTDIKLGGTTTNKDAVLPLCFGEVHNLTPLLTNPTTLEYQFHQSGSERLIEVRDNGVPVGYTVTPGLGKFVLLASPVGRITCSVQGDNAEVVGTDSTTVTVSPTTPGGGGPPTPTDALPSDAIFAPTSFWYQTIPTSVTLHSNSANFAANLASQVTSGNHAIINTYNYSAPVYTVPLGTANISVAVDDCQGKGSTDAGLIALAGQWSAVPVPSWALPSGGDDHDMAVYQPAYNGGQGALYEFWQAVPHSGGAWSGCWGGRILNCKSSDGIYSGYFGASATGLPFVGGQITAEELQRGEIRHVMGIALIDLETWSTFSWPAQRSDGYNPTSAPNRIPEGLRFRLNPSFDVAGSSLHPVAKTIAKCAQTYGFVVWDKAGSVSLRTRNYLTYTQEGQADPYDALYVGAADWTVLNGFPWDQMQFLPMNYGQP